MMPAFWLSFWKLSALCKMLAKCGDEKIKILQSQKGETEKLQRMLLKCP